MKIQRTERRAATRVAFFIDPGDRMDFLAWTGHQFALEYRHQFVIGVPVPLIFLIRSAREKGTEVTGEDLIGAQSIWLQLVGRNWRANTRLGRKRWLISRKNGGGRDYSRNRLMWAL